MGTRDDRTAEGTTRSAGIRPAATNPTGGETPTGDETPTNNPASGETPRDANPAAATGTPATATSSSTPPWGDDFDPARAWRTIQNLRKVEEEYDKLRRQVEEAEAVQRKAEEDALAEQEQFKELAEKRSAELEELKPKAEAAARYETALRTFLDAEREGLPSHILTLLDRMEPDEQLAYIAEHRETLQPSTKSGLPETPGGNAKPETVDDIEKKYLKQAGVIR